MDDVLKRGEIKPKSSNEEYTIPFDVIPLPSRGLLYTDECLAGKETVECQYLTAIQEDILTSPNLLQSGRMLDALMTSVLRDKRIDSSKLLLGDRNAIVIWLRSTGYGCEYPVQLKCRSCGKEWVHEFDLSKLEMKFLEVEPDSSKLFTFTMPQTKTTIRFKLLTSEDELGILKKVEAIQKKQGSPVDNTMSLKMAASIVEVNGESNPLAVKRFVECLPVKDAKSFRDYVNKIEPGITMSQDCECTSCGNISTEVIPIRGNFFWPDSGI